MIHGPGRRQAVQAPRRPGGAASSPTWAICPRRMRNYLARLGWGHGDDEIFSDEQAIAWFDVADVVNAPAPAGLGQARPHQQPLHPRRRRRAAAGLVRDSPPRAARPMSARPSCRRWRRTIPLVKEGAKTILELADLTVFALKTRPLALDDRHRGPAHRGDARAAGAAARARWRRPGRLEPRRPWQPSCALSPNPKASASGKFGPALRGSCPAARPRPTLPAHFPRSAARRASAASTMLFRNCGKTL